MPAQPRSTDTAAPTAGESPRTASGDGIPPSAVDPSMSARSLLRTVLGEIVWPLGVPVWTATLVHILNGLGVEEQTARQAIARAAASDWISPHRHGREVSWSLTPKLVHVFEEGAPRVYALSDPFTGWDGRWLSLHVTVPQTHRAVRRTLYAGLTWAGLGNPVPGLWLSPHVERAQEVSDLLDGLGLRGQAICLVGTIHHLGLGPAEIVERGWDLSGLSAHYERLLGMVDALHPGTPDEVVVAHVRMISRWQDLPRSDPQLPEALLPDWVGRTVARRIEALRSRWTPEVRRRFTEVNASAGGS